MTLLSLAILVGKILLRNSHFTLRALFCTRSAHPSAQTLLRNSAIFRPRPQSVLLT